uniref:Uncharacterized protein n=1 Tax=Strigamia maritima TaxID=126957 RepID=T1JEX6_STRMM
FLGNHTCHCDQRLFYCLGLHLKENFPLLSTILDKILNKMKQLIFFLLIILTTCYNVQCALSINEVKPVPGKPDHCALTDDISAETELKIGSTAQMKNNCGDVYCQKMETNSTSKRQHAGLKDCLQIVK